MIIEASISNELASLYYDFICTLVNKIVNNSDIEIKDWGLLNIC